jgi:hypothetical protein
MKFRYLILLIGFCLNTGWADFSNSSIQSHPFYPFDGPFILEISGIWPTDCHPGEQKPVVESFDGHAVEIGFEFVIIHITCNISDTPYRVLVDMSEVVRKKAALGDLLNVRVDFGGATLEQTLELVCPQAPDCANLGGDRQRPETGLYFASGLAKHGLLVARQNAATAIFPLVYDESGNNEWLFAGNHMVGDTFFTEILVANPVEQSLKWKISAISAYWLTART